MRPATLAEAYERIVAGDPQEKALPEFLDTFYLAPTAEKRLQTIVDEPPLTEMPVSMLWQEPLPIIWPGSIAYLGSRSGRLTHVGFLTVHGMPPHSTPMECASS